MLTIEDLAKALAVVPLSADGETLPAGKLQQPLAGFCTDTRKLERGQVFLTLKGPHFNGNDYLGMACQKGAAALILDEPDRLQVQVNEGTVPAETAVLVVPDALAAYGHLAGYYRQQLPGKLVAITGSVGKTGTRDMVAAGLATVFKTKKTEANLNNYIGLAQTILGTPRETEVLIVEAGIDGPGQMAPLAAMAAPDIAVITMVGSSHLEHFADRKALILEKAALAKGVKPSGWLLLNACDAATETIISQVSHCQIGLIVVSDDPLAQACVPGHTLFRAAAVRVDRGGTSFSVFAHESAGKEGLHLGRIRLPAIGSHHVYNALFACLCAYLLGADFATVATGLARFEPTGNRQRIEEFGAVTVINDTYNASEESMRAGFDLASVLAGADRRLVAVLAGINELGAESSAVHYRVGAALASHRPAAVFLLGDRSATAIAAGFKEAMTSGQADRKGQVEVPLYIFSEQTDLIKALEDFVAAGDVIFVKGSRSYRMERVCSAISDFAVAQKEPDEAEASADIRERKEGSHVGSI